jgi:hypothetical protein
MSNCGAVWSRPARPSTATISPWYRLKSNRPTNSRIERAMCRSTKCPNPSQCNEWALGAGRSLSTRLKNQASTTRFGDWTEIVHKIAQKRSTALDFRRPPARFIRCVIKDISLPKDRSTVREGLNWLNFPETAFPDSNRAVLAVRQRFILPLCTD